MKRIFVISNQKGGIGKTTTAVNMAAILNRFGHKTLLIDADPSGNTTDTLHGLVDGVDTLYDVILADKPTKLEDAIQHTINGYVVASDPLLMKADIICAGDANGLYRLQDAIQEAQDRGALDDFEYIIIDTAPTLNSLMNLSLIAATDVIIPITSDRYAVAGLMKLYEVIKAIQKRPNKDLKIYGLLLVKYNKRQKLSVSVREYIEQTAKDMGTALLDTTIPEAVVAKEAQAMKKNLIDYASSCTTELAYEEFVDEILEKDRGKKKNGKNK